jgi:phosphatidylglycerol:prolipoprotein diacylglycerol transferase
VSATTTVDLSASRQASRERFRQNARRYTAAIVPIAVLAFDFDPFLRFGDTAVRWETLGIAVGILAALVVAGVTAAISGLRLDDLLFVVLGIVPGAVVGGRLGYVLLHPAFFAADPGRIIDPGIGSLELTLGVLGGSITGILVAALLDGRPGRWLQIAAAPMLLAVALGKLAMMLGGSGQGQPTTGEPATAYLGPGPWGSLAPDIPSVPSQALEGLATLVLLLGLLGVLLAPAVRRPDGRSFFLVLALWSAMRAVIATTWRDPVVLGPLRAEQVIDVAIAVGSAFLCLVVVVRHRGRGDRAAVDARREEPLNA